MKKSIIYILLSVLSISAFAGKGLSPFSVSFALGAANFLGESGGTDGLGRNDFRDIKFNQTKFSGGLHANYRFSKWIALGLNIYYARLSGADSLSEKSGLGAHRYYRNSSFRNDVFEVSTQVEFTLYSNIVYGHRYRLYGVKGRKKFNFRLYALAGIGGFYSNPKSLYKPTGEYIALQPLGIEGQYTGLKSFGGHEIDKPYSKFNMNIPLGMGLTYQINHKITVGYEFSVRMTFTDYIDDVSEGPYMDINSFLNSTDKQYTAEEIAQINYFLSRPKADEADLDVANGTGVTGGANFRPGTSPSRGDSDQNDMYLYSLFKINYTVEKSNKVKHRPKYEKRLRLVKPKDAKAKPKDNR